MDYQAFLKFKKNFEENGIEVAARSINPDFHYEPKPQQEESANPSLYEKIVSNPVGTFANSLLDSATLGIKPLVEKKFFPEQYEASQKAAAENPTASLVGNVAGIFAPGGLIAKGVGAAGKALQSVSAVSKVASKVLPKSELLQNVVKSGVTGGAAGGIEGTIRGTTEGLREDYNFSDTLKNAAQTAGEYGKIGLIGGAGLTGLTGVGKNVYNNIKLNKALESVGKSIDEYKFPQIRELQTVARPETKATFSSSLPGKYLKTSPAQESQLYLPPAKGVYLKPQAGTNKVFTDINSVKQPVKLSSIKSGTYTPVNRGLIQAETEYNNAVEALQNKYGTSDFLGAVSDRLNQRHPNFSYSAPNSSNKFVTSEQALKYIKENDGIDLKALVDKIDEARNFKLPSKEYERLKFVSGNKPDRSYALAQKIKEYNNSPKNVLSQKLNELEKKKNPYYVDPKYRKDVTGQHFNLKPLGLERYKSSYIEPKKDINGQRLVNNTTNNLDESDYFFKTNFEKYYKTKSNDYELDRAKNNLSKSEAETMPYFNRPVEYDTNPIKSPRLYLRNDLNSEFNDLYARPQAMNESRVKTNTMINKIPELQTLEGQKFAKEFEATYGTKPNDVTISRANYMLNNDYKGTFDRIMSEGIKTAEDNIAAWKMTRDLLASKNFKLANDLISRVRPIITEYSQIVQSMSAIPKDSLEGISLNAKKVVDSMANKIKKNNPEIEKQIEEETKKIKEIVEENPDINNLNKALRKLYKKDYVNSIINLIKENKFSDETLAKAISQKYGIPSFDETDLEKISNIYKSIENIPKDKWEYRAGMDRINQTIKDKLPVSLSNKLSTFQFINMYLNTITPIKIFGGNVTSLGMEYTKNVLRHAIDKAIPGKTVTTMPSFKTQWNSIKRRTKETYKDWKHEVDTDPFKMSYDFDTKNGLKYKNKFMRGAEKLTKFIMSVAESPYKQAIYDDEIRMLMKKANVAEPTEDMINQAMEQAQKVMFANDSKFSSAVQHLRGGINTASNAGLNKLLPKKYQIQDLSGFGIGNLVQPVIKTPINMVSRAAEYSLLNLLTARNREQFVDKMAKAIIGSVFGVGLGYEGRKAGWVTGGTPKDADARDFAQDAGRQPYALNIAGNTVDVNYIQPFGMLLSFGSELASNNNNKEWYSPFVAAMDSLLNQGMLQGFAKLLGQTATSAGSLSENLADAVTGGANTLVPFSGAQNQVSKLIDPYKRETGSDNLFERNLINRTISRTPLRTTLPAKINNQGNKIPEETWYNTLFMPGNVKEVKNDAVTNELLRLYEQSNQTSQFPPKASNTISYKTSKKSEPKKLELTPEQVESFQTTLGQTNMKSIQKMLKSSEYKKANDKQKASLISNTMSKNKQEQETKFLRRLGIREYK